MTSDRHLTWVIDGNCNNWAGGFPVVCYCWPYLMVFNDSELSGGLRPATNKYAGGDMRFPNRCQSSPIRCFQSHKLVLLKMFGSLLEADISHLQAIPKIESRQQKVILALRAKPGFRMVQMIPDILRLTMWITLWWTNITMENHHF